MHLTLWLRTGSCSPKIPLFSFSSIDSMSPKFLVTHYEKVKPRLATGFAVEERKFQTGSLIC